MIQNPPKLLYKYRSLNGLNNHRKHTENMLRNGEIYFANLCEMKDPQDAFYNWFEDEVYCNLSDKELNQYLPKRIISSNRNNNIVVLSGSTQARRLRDVWLRDDARGIFCVSEVSNNFKLFDEYADSGKGICIGFNWEEMNLIYDDSPPQKQIPRKINYVETPPVIKGLPEEFLSCLYTKSVDCRYEREWRFIYKIGQCLIPRNSIKQIIFGPTISDLDKMYVESLLSDLVNVDFFTVKLSDDNYGYQLIKVEKIINSESVSP